jgi:RNA polymerase sigma-70 factor (ECF subfamily)
LSQAQRCYRIGHLAFPEIEWSEQELADAWLRHAALGFSEDPSEDDFVRLACIELRPGAAEALDRAYIRPLAPRLASICKSDTATQAALQEVREKLLAPPRPRIESFRAPGNFRAWIKVLAVRTALDSARRLGVLAEREVELDERLEAVVAGPEEEYLRAEARDEIRAALRSAVSGLPERERFALRMHLVAGWSVTQIGRVYSVHKSTAARWLISAKERLGNKLQVELADRLGSGYASSRLYSELPSRLDVGLSSLFSTTGVFSASAAPLTP